MYKYVQIFIVDICMKEHFICTYSFFFSVIWKCSMGIYYMSAVEKIKVNKNKSQNELYSKAVPIKTATEHVCLFVCFQTLHG